MSYESKVGYSLAFKKRELTFFFIGVIVIIMLLLIFIPSPINYYLSLAVLLISLIFFGLGILLMKLILGVITKIEGNNLRVYKADSFNLNPKDNEMMLAFGGNVLHAHANLTKNNVSSVRKIENPDEIKAIKKMPNVINVLGAAQPIIGRWHFLMNNKEMEKISFISDYSNMVEISVKKMTVKYPSFFGGAVKPNSVLGNKISNLKDIKILVSVKNPDKFISHLKE